jgi:hypothetical protein
MPIVQHEFTHKILEIVNAYFPNQAMKVLNSSELLQVSIQVWGLTKREESAVGIRETTSSSL